MEGKSKWEMLKSQAAEAEAAAAAELQERAQRAIATREAELHSSHTRALNDAKTAVSDGLHALRGALEGELATLGGGGRGAASELQAQLADEMLKLQGRPRRSWRGRGSAGRGGATGTAALSALVAAA